MIYLFLNNIVSSILIFLAYYIGLVNGQKIVKDKTISIPERIEEKKEEIKVEQEQLKYETIMSNIDAYDGTSDGQKDISI